MWMRQLEWKCKVHCPYRGYKSWLSFAAQMSLYILTTRMPMAVLKRWAWITHRGDKGLRLLTW
jgi:hypothetical protein